MFVEAEVVTAEVAVTGVLIIGVIVVVLFVVVITGVTGAGVTPIGSGGAWTVVAVLFVGVITGVTGTGTGVGTVAVWTVAAGGLTTVDRKSLKTLKKPVMVPPVPSTIEVSAENTPEVFTSTAGLLAS
ncbi:MAG: hypothetical protein ABGY08_01045, partial [Gammaproteobacteria bacterium]